MYLRFFANLFGYRAASTSGRQEPKSKHRHDPALEKYKKARQDLHPKFSQQEQGSSRRPSRATRGAPQYREGGDGDSSPLLVMKLRIIDLSTGKGRALTETQTETQMMVTALRR